MPFKCVVPGCNSNYYHVTGTPSIQMVRFPLNLDLMEKWLHAIGRPGFIPNQHSHICIKHFAPEDTVRRLYRQHTRRLNDYFVRIKHGAVPSVFESDPSKHECRIRIKAKVVNIPAAPCEVGSSPRHGLQVEFKPEMWEDKSTNKQEVVKKRGRGRPRKIRNFFTDENSSVNGNKISVNGNKVDVNGAETRINGSPEMFRESVPCCALACPNTSDTHVMNRLPGEPSLRQLWIQKLDRLAWTPDSDSALCEIHFEQEMWDSNVGGEKSLKRDAVPTLFLHGEAIKSWITFDNNGKIKNIDVKNRETEDENALGIDCDGGDNEEDDEQDIIVKHEALEPEIDMVEGNEEVVSKDPFETIFCDVTYPDGQQDFPMDFKRIKLEQDNGTSEIGEFENPLSPETVYVDDQSESNQSEIDKEEDNLNINIFSVKSLQEEAEKNNFLMIPKPEHLKEWKITRRNSSQLTNQFQCPICARRLSRKKNLEVHMQKLHPNGELSENHRRPKPKVEDIVKLKDVVQEQEQQRQCFRVISHPSSPTPAESILSEPLVTSTASEGDSHSPSTIVTSPRPLDPSPAGGEMKKQFLVFIPQPPLEQQISAPIENPSFTVSLTNVPAEKRLALRIKLKELVDAVVHKNLNPERIIIAYDRT